MGRTLTVKGIGKISVKPDYTVVSISLKVLNKVYDDAMEKAGMQIEALREALCAIGFEKQDLKTTGFNVHSRYNNERDKNGNYKNVFAGFECIHQLKLEFDFDMKKLALVLSALSTSSTEPEITVKFTVKDKSAVCEELLRNAVCTAEQKAKLLASASGVTLGDIASIDYNWDELDFISPTRYEASNDCFALKASARSIDIEPDDISVSDSVTIIWEIK